MKRTPLLRRAALRQRAQLRSRPKPRRDEPGRMEWKTPRAGYCTCGCERFAMHLERHHVIELQTVRREGRDDLAWDLRNSMLLRPECHARHTSALRRVPLASVPAAAFVFARELLGDDRAALYLARYYSAASA